MENQRLIWDREYGRRGTIWSGQSKNLPQLLEGKIILEAGVGNGKTLSGILAQKPAYTIAYDFSPAALHRCPKSAPLLRADALGLPFKDAVFDAVVLHYLLDNLLEADRIKAVAEAKRVLKDGGLVLFEDFAVGDFRQETAKRTGEPEANTILKKKGLICHYFTQEEVRKLFGGFTKVEVGLRQSAPIRDKAHLMRCIVSAEIYL
jgi:ubiquinone/menaquinone biosynthesis C-methylase UbiE